MCDGLGHARARVRGAGSACIEARSILGPRPCCVRAVYVVLVVLALRRAVPWGPGPACALCCAVHMRVHLVGVRVGRARGSA